MKRIVVLLLACLPSVSLGVTYKCVDSRGHVSYSQTPEPGKQCTTPTLPEVQSIPFRVPKELPQTYTPKGPDTTPPGDSSQGGAADLEAARKALAEAKKKLAEQEAVRYGDEKNYQRVLDRLKPYQEAVQKAEERVKELEQGSK